jgi:hypothetical protein
MAGERSIGGQRQYRADLISGGILVDDPAAGRNRYSDGFHKAYDIAGEAATMLVAMGAATAAPSGAAVQN